MFARVSNDWHEIAGEDEAFFLRAHGPGDFRFRGADLGILVTKGRMQTAEGFMPRCRRYIDGIRNHYRIGAAAESPRLNPTGLRQVAGDRRPAHVVSSNSDAYVYLAESIRA